MKIKVNIKIIFNLWVNIMAMVSVRFSITVRFMFIFRIKIIDILRVWFRVSIRVRLDAMVMLWLD